MFNLSTTSVETLTLEQQKALVSFLEKGVSIYASEAGLFTKEDLEETETTQKEYLREIILEECGEDLSEEEIDALVDERYEAEISEMTEYTPASADYVEAVINYIN